MRLTRTAITLPQFFCLRLSQIFFLENTLETLHAKLLVILKTSARQFASQSFFAIHKSSNRSGRERGTGCT
jgi:hypothetical protein